MHNNAWPIAAAFAALCASIAYYSVNAPAEPKSPLVTCIEMRGLWKEGWGRTGWSGTCDFPKKTAEVSDGQ